MQAISNDDQRADFRIPVDLLLNKYVAGSPHAVRATNISRRGLGLARLNEPDGAPTSVGLQFQLPNSDRVITCAARIVHRARSCGEQGAVFTHVAPEHQQLIDDYILSQLQWP
jgi:hypothetical protein